MPVLWRGKSTGATRREGDSSGGRGRRVFLLLLFLSFSLNALAVESGWLYICSRKECYHKPFVVPVSSDHLVIFITGSGRIYKGRCLRGGPCRVVPRKRFYSSAEPVLFIEVQLGALPRVVSSGLVDPFNEVKLFKRGR